MVVLIAVIQGLREDAALLRASLEKQAESVQENSLSMARLTRFSHHLPVEARDRPVITSLRLPAVLTVLSKYTSARQAARASY